MQDEHLNPEGHPNTQPSRTTAPPAPHGASGRSPARSVWPVVLGIVAIVFGLAGFLNNMLGAVAPFLIEGFVSSLTGELSGEAEETVRATMEITNAWRNWTVGLGLVGALISGLLLVGGILLLMRRVAAAQLLKAWALMRMVMVVVAAVIGLRVQQQTFEAMRNAMGAEMEQVPEAFLSAAALFGTAFSLLFGWALPVVVLIWFGRQAIKDEVAGWM